MIEDCFIITYNISNKNTFNCITKWIEDAKRNISNKTKIVLFGNKINLNGNREISYEEGKNLSEKYDLLFYEVDENNIQKVFYDIVKSVANQMLENNNDISKSVANQMEEKDNERNRECLLF